MKKNKKKKNKVKINSNNPIISNDNIELLIAKLKEENDRNSEKLEKMLNKLYEKNKKENEIQGALDVTIKHCMSAFFFIIAIAFFGAIYFVFIDTNTITNKVILIFDYTMMGIISVLIGLNFRKEKNRNFIISCFSALMALLAIIIAMSK